MTADTVLSLYHHGSLICAAIVAVYLLLRWGVGHVPFLQEPQHAHYATIAVTVLGVFAVPAAAGALPTLNMAIAAIGTLAALALPGLTASPAKSPQSGSAKLTLLCILALAAVALCSCSWWSSSGKARVENGGKAAAACAVGDLERYAGDIEKDLGGASYTADLDKFKADHNFTQDALNCLIDGVLAVLVPGPVSGEVSPVVLHGREYLAAHGAVPTAVLLPSYSVRLAAWWLQPNRADCEPPNEMPAVDCRPYQAEIYDGCHWQCEAQ